MTMNEWHRVREALDDPRWDFRTVAGIARDTGLDPERVKCLLDRHRPEIRQTLSQDRKKIFTLKSRPMKVREVIADLLMFAGNRF
jgi:hypothetical protein